MLAVEAKRTNGVPAAVPDARASRLAKLNCAGAGCADRDGCRRYVDRIATGKQVAKNGYEFKTYAWASFDVERRVIGGRECPAFIRARVR